MVSIPTTYDDWQEGKLTDREALDSMCQQLASIEDSLEPLEEQKQQIRGHLSEVVEKLGGRVALGGFGKLEISSPSIVPSYDRAELDKLVTELKKAGHTEIAQKISACRKESMRSGGLRIVREKR